MAKGRPPLLGWLLATLLVASASEAQTVIQNDSVIDFASVGIQTGFVADERASAWLTATCNGNLTAVQILWLSFLGGQPDTLGQAITISEAGSFPVPGPQLRELLGPVLSDGFFNQYPVIPAVPVTTGQTLVVAFQFLTNPPLLGPSIANDIDGCQTGRNGIFAIPPIAWFDSCGLGVSGDFAIRGVLDCTVSEIFTDGFESGDTSAWSATVP